MPTPKKRILLADDNPSIRKVAMAFLKNAACVVDQARDGAEAVALYAAESHDMVLMDLEMDGLDGLEACRRIRAMELERGLPAAPILIMTGHGREEFERIRREVPGLGFLPKPLRKPALLEALGLNAGQEGQHTAAISSTLKPLVSGFLDTTRQDLEAMRQSLGQADLETVRRLGHSLKGAARTYGFETLGKIGLALETSAGERDRDALEKSLRALEDHLSNLKIEYT